MQKQLLFLVFILLLLSTQGKSQSNAERVLADLEKKMHLAYERTDLDSAIFYAFERQKKSKESGFDTIYAASFNDLGFLHKKKGNYQKAEEYYRRSIALEEAIREPSDPELAVSYNNLALLLDKIGAYEAALALLKKSVKIMSAAHGENSAEYAIALNNLANTYNDMGYYEQSIEMLQKVAQIDRAESGEQSAEYASTLSNLGACYEDIGRYDEAEPLYLQSMQIWENIRGKEHIEYTYPARNLATLYIVLGRYEEAADLLNHVSDVQKKQIGANHPEYSLVLEQLGILYDEMGDLEAAQQYLVEALEIRKQVSTNSIEYTKALLLMGIMLIEKESYAQAETYLKEALAAAKRSALKVLSVGIYNELGRLYADWGNPAKGYAFFEKALSLNANKDELPDVNSADFALFLKQSNWLDKEEVEPSLRGLMFSASSEATSFELNRQLLLHEHRQLKGFRTTGDKFRVVEENSAWVERALAFSAKRGDGPEQAFAFMEQNKAILLAESFQSQRAMALGHLPDSLVSYERRLKEEQLELDKQLIESKGSKDADVHRAAMNTLQQEMNAFKTRVKNDFPKYYQLKYERNLVEVKAIQDLLEPKAALLEYFVGEENTYLLYLRKESLELHVLPVSRKDLAVRVKKLRKVLSDYDFIESSPDEAYQSFVENAHWFHENLMKDIIDPDVERLLLVSDGELGHLPFEVFLTEPAKGASYAQLPYLLRKYQISYHYAAQLLLESRSTAEKKAAGNGELLAMAAYYNQDKVEEQEQSLRGVYYRSLRKVLVDLPAARDEVQELSERFKGLFITGVGATEQAFKAKAREYDIIHLAMHGALNPEYPSLSSLVFSENGDSLENNFLQAYEIIQMQLNAQLVVLSACETGYGKFQRGEGVLSLARSFMYAGVPSVLVSLWQVSDASTAEIMKSFYEGLEDGADKDEALRLAKLKFLENKKGLMAHPAYWAPFVQVGDYQNIDIATQGVSWDWRWLAAGSLLLLLVGLWYYKRKGPAA